MQRNQTGLLATLALAAAMSAWPIKGAAAPPEFDRVSAGVPMVLTSLPARRDQAFADYEFELFATRPAVSGAAFVSLPGTKRLRAVALRETKTDHIGLALVRAARAQCDDAQWVRFVAAFSKLGVAFGGRHRFVAGESFSLELVPGEGVRVLINGTVVGRQIGDAEFFSLLVRSWAADAPANV